MVCSQKERSQEQGAVSERQEDSCRDPVQLFKDLVDVGLGAFVEEGVIYVVAVVFPFISHLCPAHLCTVVAAATLFPAFPLESWTTLSMPIDLQWLTKTAAPRSLKERVGMK